MTLPALSKVDAILVKMLEAYPSLRHTRLDAIHDVVTYSGHEWNDDGSVSISPDSLTPSGRFDKTEDEDEDVIKYRQKIEGGSKNRYDHEWLASRLLTLRQRALKEAFVRDNAELIVRAGESYRHTLEDNGSGYGFSTTMPDANFRLIESMPDNADPEWKAAFIELLEGVMRYNYKAGKFDGMAADYAKRYADDLANAKVKAKKLLIRLKGSDEDKQKLRNEVLMKLRALKAEAASMGFELTGELA